MKQDKDAIVKYRLDRSESSLLQAIHLTGINEWNGVVNRLYYAAFYGVSALLFHYGYNVKTHSSQKSTFNEIFLLPEIISRQTGGVYNLLFTYRQNADYSDFIIFTRDETIPLIKSTTDLISDIKKLIADV